MLQCTTLVKDKLLQARSFLRELVTADSWVTGTWLCQGDWLAVRLAEVCEKDLLPPLLVLHKETKSNLTLQDFCDEPTFASRFDFSRMSVNFTSVGQSFITHSCTHAEFVRFFELGHLTLDLCELWEQ